MYTNSLRFLLLLATFSLAACDNDCDFERAAACSDTVPTDEACQAYFQRWFYAESEDACAFVSYSGCSAWGFASQEECEACKCQ